MKKSELREIVEKELYAPLAGCREYIRQYYAEHPEAESVVLGYDSPFPYISFTPEGFEPFHLMASLEDDEDGEGSGEDTVDVCIMDETEFYEQFGDEDLWGRGHVPLDAGAMTDAFCEFIPTFITAYRQHLKKLAEEAEILRIEEG